MPFHPKRYRKVNTPLEISSRSTCRFQLEVDQSVEFSVDMSVGSEFSVEDFSYLLRID